jgi:LysR family glycine cleavage system transcriptional activator
VFVDSNAAIEAALAGRGVALVRRSLVVVELAQGRLLAVPGPALDAALAYYLVYREATLTQPAARAFHDWMLAQAGVLKQVVSPSTRGAEERASRRTGRRAEDVL